jgi:shikimate 5-dehydrogenase
MSRQVLGFVGPACPSTVRKIWNELLSREGIDGFFDGYRALKSADVQQRLSEMYLLERRGYVIGKGLAGDSASMMDKLDPSAIEAGAVDTVVNDGGVFTGYHIGDVLDFESIKQRFTLFFGSSISARTLEWLRQLTPDKA